MKTYIKPTIYQGLDCLQCSITNILNYKMYPEVNTLWKSCQLIYEKSLNDLGVGVLTGTEFTLENELEWIHNIRMQKFYNENQRSYIEKLRNYLEKKRTGFINFRYLFFKISFGYCSFHSPHIVIATEIIGETIVCVDDYQQYIGKIPIDQVLKASCIDGDELAFITLDISQAKNQLSNDDYMEIISKNISFLLGEGYQTINNNKNTFFGLDAISKFIEDCKSNSTNLDIASLLGKMHNEIAKLANRHFSFANVINAKRSIYTDLDNLFDTFISCCQEWKIISNMCLKGQYTGKEDMYNRVFIKLEDVCKTEMKCLKSLKKKLYN